MAPKVAKKCSPAASDAAMMVQISTDGQPKLHCPVCDKTLNSLNGYVKHVAKHDPPGGFLCRYCDGRFCSEEELKRHRNDVHITIACRICKDLVFPTEAEYREHIRTTHNGIDREMFQCDKCGAEYKTLEPFRRHRDTQCGTVKPHVCDECGISFVTKYNLKQHKESHSGEHKFCCSYCGKHFQQKGRLLGHERSHTGEKPYKCDVCGKCFAHRESIVTHSSIHTGIRLVECRCCHSRFSCYSNLIKHRRTRPETCGQPEYDAPKHRRRIHHSRIPATVNPTSEIKVIIQNKVIKPDVKESPHKRTPQPKRQRRKRISKSSDAEESGCYGNEEDRDVCDPIESVALDEVAVDDAEVPVKVEQAPSEDILMTANEFESCEVSRDVLEEVPTTSIKQEEEGEEEEEYQSILNEKDNILNGLLYEDDQSEAVPNLEVRQETDLLDNADILEETEVILVNHIDGSDILNDNDEGEAEEDVLNIADDYVADSIDCDELFEAMPMGESPEQEFVTAIGEEDEMPRTKTPQKAEEEEEGAKEAYTLRSKTKQSNGATEEDLAAFKELSPPPKPTYKELKARWHLLKEDQKSWQCPYCIKIYHLKKPYERHLRDEHQRPESDVRDIVCADPMEGIGEEWFKCPICEKVYLLEKRLKSHIALHGPDGNLVHKCPCYCNLFFGSKDEATAHAQAQHRDLLYCEPCEKFLTSHDSLKSHQKYHHWGGNEVLRNVQRKFVCDKCGKKFSGRTSLNDHVRSDCGRLPLYQCNVCGKNLTTAGILKTHLLLHKDETPFQCEICGKTFKVKAQYKTHLKTRHTYNKPFKCHLCPKAYPYRESLLTHMTQHTGIKRYLCIGCGKRFTCISNLQAHRKVQAETCGLLPLNSKATQYMGVQKGNLLMGAKPEAGFEYTATNTLLAKEVFDRDPSMVNGLEFPEVPSDAVINENGDCFV